MVLLGEAFYGHGESLNLSLEGGGIWFISLIIVDGHHRASKYHAILCLGSDSMAYKIPHRRCQLMMPKIVSKSHSPHMLYITPANRNKKDLAESTGVVPAKYPLNVKLENFHNSRVSKLG